MKTTNNETENVQRFEQTRQQVNGGPRFDGYLPQMLEEAAEELAAMAADEPSLALAVKFLKQEMRARYDEQMTPA